MKEKLTKELCLESHKQVNKDYVKFSILKFNSKLIQDLECQEYVKPECIDEVKKHFQGLGYYVYQNGFNILYVSLNKPEIKEKNLTLFEKFIDRLINLISK